MNKPDKQLFGSLNMSIRNCTSCNGPMAEKGSVEFGCPACGATIRRCYRCREQSVEYVCQTCGLRGP
ncbi:zinc finger domain-containing protein [Methanospirillum sp.]|uniref:zinc finger domain-containing protein n=1 Tax=Methanospirillum sp. TaxID=45200 RepID=UPI002D1F9BD9|nr:zinc finger domain-containing protein [Methanospirillum sp.]